MSRAGSSPVLIAAEGSGIPLERISLRDERPGLAYKEDWVQDLVFRYPSSLPVEDIDASFAKPVPLCREMSTLAGPVDVVYVTRDGRPVIVEAKLWRNPEARRKVIGQILDYAKELTRWSFEDFDTQVRAARRRVDGEAPKGVLELLGIAPNSPEEPRFHDSLTRALRHGDFLLLIVGDGIREGAAEIAAFLRSYASLHFVLGMVELAIYEVPGGGRLVMPRVMVQSDIVRRMVVDVRNTAPGVTVTLPLETDVSPEEEADSTDLSARVEAFWAALRAELRLDNPRQEVGPSRGKNLFFRFPEEWGAWVSAYLSPATERAGVYLALRQGPSGDRVFAALREDHEALERELGCSVEWKTSRGYHTATTAKPFQAPLLEKNPAEVRRKLADWTNRYVNTFRPRVEKLIREIG